MDQQQYTVLERVTTKTQLEEVLQVLKTPAKKEGMLKDQLMIRYVGFESVDKKSWSCAKEGRTGSWQELKGTFEVVLEGEESTPLRWGRLGVPASALEADKDQCLGEEPSLQRQELAKELKEQRVEAGCERSSGSFRSSGCTGMGGRLLPSHMAKAVDRCGEGARAGTRVHQ